jgi:hypothetical protein
MQNPDLVWSKYENDLSTLEVFSTGRKPFTRCMRPVNPSTLPRKPLRIGDCGSVKRERDMEWARFLAYITGTTENALLVAVAQLFPITFRVEPEQAAVLLRFLRAVAQQDIVRTLDAPDQVKAFEAGSERLRLALRKVLERDTGP